MAERHRDDAGRGDAAAWYTGCFESAGRRRLFDGRRGAGARALWLSRAGDARDVTLCFEHGRVAAIEAAHGAAELDAMFDCHTGEPRRISHVGIGINLYLQRPVGWTLVDEHCHGALLIAFGENRYLGRANASSLNVDFAIPNADLLADGQAIVVEGRLMV